MTSKYLGRIAGEYKQVSRKFFKSGHYELCKKAHATPISRADADALTLKLIGKLPRYRGHRGWAHSKSMSITLPNVVGLRNDNVPYLRVGVVLHECAHVITYKSYKIGSVFGHGMEFCEIFGKLICDYYNETVSPPVRKKVSVAETVAKITDYQREALQQRIVEMRARLEAKKNN